MILHIVPEITDDVIKGNDVNIKLMDYNTFNLVEVHPFIVTTTWEKIIITLQKGIKAGFLSQVIKLKAPIQIIIKNETTIDYELIMRLGELLHDKSIHLRKLYSTKDNIKSFLQQEGVIFE